MTVGKMIRQEAVKIIDLSSATLYLRAAKYADSAPGAIAMLKIAQALPGIDANSIEFDADPWALNLSLQFSLF